MILFQKVTMPWHTPRPRGQEWLPFADNRFIFLYENYCIFLQNSLKFVPKGPINNKPSFLQITAWYLRGNKPLFESMMAWFTDTYLVKHQGTSISTHWGLMMNICIIELGQHQFRWWLVSWTNAELSIHPRLQGKSMCNWNQNIQFLPRKCIRNCCLWSGCHVIWAPVC